MAADDRPAPRFFQGVMPSSTFRDLKEHRAALIEALAKYGFHDVAMENDSAKPSGDVITSSLCMVRDAAAVVVIIGQKYGQIPPDRARNPKQVSISELEFDEALRLDRPILLFLMGDDHLLKPAQMETVAKNRKKVAAFRERAKRRAEGSSIHRIYAQFNSLDEFARLIGPAIADLRDLLRARVPAADPPIPRPPAFYAEPRYVAGHAFQGRARELEMLDDWAAPAAPHAVMLFEAIGGTGKSFLTWHWVTQRAASVRSDWRGVFWYSFYERGAILADFCQRALAYITSAPLADLCKKKTPELADDLLRHLTAWPWLLILDGLERVLVSYHRYDAAQLVDEDAGATDVIARRDPCAAIRPGDDALLRDLAGAAPSRILISTRLTPRTLLSASNLPIAGVRREVLAGLRPPDAEALLRACGITGDGVTMQEYLQRHCDCHPLVTGVLAGLVGDYLPDRGNFSAWAADPAAGGQLDFGALDLKQKRNHILHAALAALPEKNRALLSMLALLSESVGFGTLKALNPYLPSPPEIVEMPEPPLDDRVWWIYTPDIRQKLTERYQERLKARADYESALSDYQQSSAVADAHAKLGPMVSDLERRGLLQYDRLRQRYDLHPVVRSVAAGMIHSEEKASFGQRIVDHFSSEAHRPYQEAETLDDLASGLHVLRTLLALERYSEALMVYKDGIGTALTSNLEEIATELALLQGFFVGGWEAPVPRIDARDNAWLANAAGVALFAAGKGVEARTAYAVALRYFLEHNDWANVVIILLNIRNTIAGDDRLKSALRLEAYAREIAILAKDRLRILQATQRYMHSLVTLGRHTEAKTCWDELKNMGLETEAGLDHGAEAAESYALLCFQEGRLRRSELDTAEKLARARRVRVAVRRILGLRGAWHLSRKRWDMAADALGEAVQMARGVQKVDASAEAKLAVALFRGGKLPDAWQEAVRLQGHKEPDDRWLAELWLEISKKEADSTRVEMAVAEARTHVLKHYRWAWADGEPYVYRYELDQTLALLKRLHVKPPSLLPYDAAKDEKFPWEKDLLDAIVRLRAEKGPENGAAAPKAVE